MPSTFTWTNGQLVPYLDARVHVESEAVLRGATAFEALRAYQSASGELVLFRVHDHLDRLFNTSIRFLRLACEYGPADLLRAICDLLDANGIRDDAHIRVFAYVDHTQPAFGVGPKYGSGGTVCITAKEGASEPADPLRVTLSPWRRISDLSMASRVKVAANNMNGRIAMVDAVTKGFDYPVMLTEGGKVSGGSAMNLFMVRHGVLSTPRLSDAIVEGITRDTVLTLARAAGIQTQEREIDATELYVADELFFSSTGFEITPLIEIDNYRVGLGEPGPVTRQLMQVFQSTVRGKMSAPEGWITPVQSVKAGSAS
jgi:branched-chain amino acid aminotransferase